MTMHRTARKSLRPLHVHCPVVRWALPRKGCIGRRCSEVRRIIKSYVTIATKSTNSTLPTTLRRARSVSHDFVTIRLKMDLLHRLLTLRTLRHRLVS